jgi:RimJ/RimL family protein N-acetyltransferase
MTRETIARMYQYPFAQCGSQMVLHCVRADNEAPLRILAALGCMFVKVPRLYGREHDGVLCLLTREAWDESKFNPERIVEPVREAA